MSVEQVGSLPIAESPARVKRWWRLSWRLKAEPASRGSSWWQRWQASHMRWAQELDFLGGAPPAAWWAWVLLLLGVATMLTWALEQDDLQEQLERAEKRLYQAQQLAAQVTMRTQLKAQERRQTVQALGPQSIDGAMLQAALRLTQQLAYPWAAILQAVEEASGEVALLAFRHDVQQDSIHLEAAVRDDVMALEWLDALSADHAHFEQVYLQSLEPLQQPVGVLTTKVQVRVVLNHQLLTPPDAKAVQAAAVASAASSVVAGAAARPASAVSGMSSRKGAGQ